MRIACLAALVLVMHGCTDTGGPSSDGDANNAGGDARQDGATDPPDAPISGVCGGGKVLLARQVALQDHDIFVVDVETGVETAVFTGDTDDTEPTWSPDFTRILFRRDYEYYVANADGTSPVRITDGDSGSIESDAAWSPQGDRVAFVHESSLGDFGPDIYAVNADGTGRVRLTSGGYTTSPQWSPDGTRIAYLGYIGGRVVATMNANGSNKQVLTGLMAGVQGDQPPRWSPDGTRIAFLDRDAICGTRIWLIDADGTDRVRVADDCDPDWPGGLDDEPAWSPDGSRLVFNRSFNDDNVGMWVVTPDGVSTQRISTWMGADMAWSPDGGCLAFVFTGDSHYNINRMPAGGGARVELTHTESPMNNWHPSWAR